jgi:hypothetical protein
MSAGREPGVKAGFRASIAPTTVANANDTTAAIAAITTHLNISDSTYLGRTNMTCLLWKGRNQEETEIFKGK